MRQKFIISALLLPLFLTATVQHLHAQTGPPPHVERAIQEIEAMITATDETAVNDFIENSILSSETADRKALSHRLRNIKTKLQGRWQDVAVRPDPDGVRMIFSEKDPILHLKAILNKEGILDLNFVEPPRSITFTKSNIDSVFRDLANRGLAGLAYFKIDGEVLYKKGFGMANRNQNIPNTTATIFGVGSRPIDFTRAAIHLLAQNGEISFDDSISHYFQHVPADKQAITIRHLMTGQSGLPDFFDTPDDWDPDLSWIERETAVKRLLSQELLFEPGTDRQHSHGAFGLLAALIEQVSGQSYFEYINEHFFQPAGMNHTNEYGIAGDHTLPDFAVGYGSQSIGIPNIPPNWGPTSWLIKGSGGMYSNLGDLLQFYDYIRSGNILNADHMKAFEQPTVNLDGSVRGFELFNAFNANGDEVYIFLNDKKDIYEMRALIEAAENFVMQSED